MSLAIVALSACSKKDQVPVGDTIVLVHGSWSDATAWNAVIPALQAQGHEVIAVNLPGHGNDNTAFAGITMKNYVDAVKNAIGNRKNVILVGHSMAGLVISQVGEEIPGNIKELVYLAAFLPKTGESLLSLAQQDAGSHLGTYLTIDQDHSAAVVDKSGVIDVFAADAPKATQDYLLANWKSEPLTPLATPVTLSDANFGSITKAYIYTTNDHAVSYPFQQKMVGNSNAKKTFILASSHTPFLSMPDKLAQTIIGAIK